MTLAKLKTAGTAAGDRPRPGRRVEIYRARGVVLLVSGAKVVRAIHTSTGVGGDSPDLGTPPGKWKIYRKELRSGRSRTRPGCPTPRTGSAAGRCTATPTSRPSRLARVRAPAAPEAKIVYDFVSIGTPVRSSKVLAWRHPSRAAPRRDRRRRRRARRARAVARDLRRQFGERYRIVRATSARGADALKELVTRGEQVALLVADQRMPGMAGTEYLVEARKLVPDAKRVLLTAYADTEAAIQAINEVDLDYYLLKPWDPPEEQLYPVVEDLLTTWEAGAALESGGVRVIGHRFSRDSHDLRDFLARNRVPMRWLDVERDAEARELLTVADVDGERLPVALLEDGTCSSARRARARRAPRRVRSRPRPSTTTW
jgi:CheY-like chemotaxis protein